MNIKPRIAIRYCYECKAEIDDSGLCSYGCKFDTEIVKRPSIIATYVLEKQEEHIGDRDGAPC